MKPILKKIMEGHSLFEKEAFNLLAKMTENEVPEAQVGAILGSLRTKGRQVMKFLICKILKGKGHSLSLRTG